MSSAEGSGSGSEWSSSWCARWAGGYRVRVCLRRYFADERARAVLAVRGERRVRWLRRRVRRLFALRGAFALLLRGHLLPPSEPLRAVLRADEQVQVIPLPDDRRASRQREDKVKKPQTEDKVISSTSTVIAKVSAAICDDVPAETPAESFSPMRGGAGDSPPVEAPPGDADADGAEESLHSLKSRALALLDTWCSENAADGAPPAKRRRRVRRRPRRAPSPPAAASPSPPAPSPAAASPAAASRPASPCAPGAQGDVARNEDARARRPRMVHSLCLD